ncbi:MAG: ArsR/SmtB family transcription factor [Desulfosudaceae bacterium]
MLLHNDLCVGGLAGHLGISKPAVSQHLKILRRAGLVRGEKRGYWTHYTVNRQEIAQIGAALKNLGAASPKFNNICWQINENPPDKLKCKDGQHKRCQTTDQPDH